MKRKDIGEPNQKAKKQVTIKVPTEQAFPKEGNGSKAIKAPKKNPPTPKKQYLKPVPVIPLCNRIFEANLDDTEEIYNINIFLRFPRDIKRYRVNLIQSENEQQDTNC